MKPRAVWHQLISCHQLWGRGAPAPVLGSQQANAALHQLLPQSCCRQTTVAPIKQHAKTTFYPHRPATSPRLSTIGNCKLLPNTPRTTRLRARRSTDPCHVAVPSGHRPSDAIITPAPNKRTFSQPRPYPDSSGPIASANTKWRGP
jgi:hypothetical protein